MSKIASVTRVIDMKSFGEAQSKPRRAYAQSGQYHTIVESPDS